MAEGVLFKIAEGNIGQLGNTALQEIGLLWGINDELEKLKNTVTAIQAVLLDAEEKQSLNNAIKTWLGGLKDVVFEADDLLDDFSTEALRREAMTQNKKAKQVHIFFSKSNQLAYGYKMGRKIKAIREKLDAIEADNKQFGLVERLNETQVKTRPRQEAHFFEHAKAIIGRENEKEEIIKLILNSDNEENVSVLPIVGIGGMGKTTLAQLVFNDEEIKNHFEVKLWVCVSDDFDEKLIVEKILEFAKNKKPENLDMNNLIKDLHKEIEGKRYLLVLDDVWNDNHAKWLRIKKLLMNGARGSTILVTTRGEKVAKIVHTIEPYFLRCLNEHKSWSLFKQMAFEKGQEPQNPSFNLIGKEIVEKCKGIPLVINSIGGLLYFRNSEKDWLSFKNNEWAKVTKETDIIPTLKLSYDHLPSHLKQCLAYCSLFPKDYKIFEKSLINLWMAQGFIRSSPDQSLEDIGHEYFMELLWRSFFQKDVQDELHELYFDKKYKMHDLMHDLVTSVAGNENTLYLKARDINGNQNTHHISFGFTLDSSFQDPTPFFKARRTRTFLLPSQPIYRYNGSRLNESTCDAIFSCLKFLRLLDLHNMGIEIVPSSISRLKHLRYLDLSRNMKIKMLPNSICMLQNLQTLKLTYCDGIKELPNDITKLVNLRYLQLDSCSGLTHMPCGLGKLTNLRELSQFVMSHDSDSVSRLHGKLKELSRLNDLRGDLQIRNLRHGKDAALELKDANLKVEQYLKSFSLEWKKEEVNDTDVVYDEQSLECLQPHPNLKVLCFLSFQGVRFPSWLSSLTNLQYLQLHSCGKCQHLPLLDFFPSLKVMRLIYLDSLEHINSEKLSDSPILPSLKRLIIIGCPNLKGWWRRMDSVEDGNYVGITATKTFMAKDNLVPSFPCLSSLIITNCPQLSSMPLFPYLKNLHLEHSSMKPLQLTMMMGMTSMTTPEIITSTTEIASTFSSFSSVATSSFASLSKLKRLALRGMVEPLTEELLRNFTSINHLDIHNSCPLTRVLRHLTALQSLYISDFDGDEMEWQELNSLSTLGFLNFSKVSLPVGLQHVTSLKSLKIQDCPSLVTIPEWICNLTSLQQLDIWNCPNLTSLPEGIRALTSLQTLTIKECPVLLKRCKRETDEDWSKIAHIPNLDMYEGDSERPNLKKTWHLTKIFGHCNCSTSQQLND